MGEGFDELPLEVNGAKLTPEEYRGLSAFELSDPVLVKRSDGTIEDDWQFMGGSGNHVRVAKGDGTSTKDVDIIEFLELNHEHVDID